MIRVTIRGLIISVLVGTAACGKFANPLPPEAVAPKAINELEVTADTTGVNFKWKSPDLNQRGRELQFIDGYRVYRKSMDSEDQLLDEDVPFELTATLQDTHLEVLDKMREEARAAGKSGRKVQVDVELKKFEYADHNVQPGKIYAYRIVPFNQGDVEGQIQKIIRVQYRGETSQIVMIDESEFDEEGFDELE